MEIVILYGMDCKSEIVNSGVIEVILILGIVMYYLMKGVMFLLMVY